MDLLVYGMFIDGEREREGYYLRERVTLGYAPQVHIETTRHVFLL